MASKSSLPEFGLVVAATRAGGIGKNGSLPWVLRKDMAHFKRVTSTAPEGLKNAVIMGRKTWESIPAKHRPLANRLNVILTRNPAELEVPQGVLVASSIGDALQLTAKDESIHKRWLIGGAGPFNDALSMPECRTIHLTVVEGDFDCDVFMNEIDRSAFKMIEIEPEVQEENGIKFQFQTLVRQS